MTERYELGIERIRKILTEDTVSGTYRRYFRSVAEFILQIDRVKTRLSEETDIPIERWQEENDRLYEDILPENYGKSYANPAFASADLGETFGAVLSFLYAEIRGEIAYVYEKRLEELTILNELFIEIYNCFEEEKEPAYKQIQEIIYWYASDYCDVFLKKRIEEQIDPSYDFAYQIITESDLTDLRYLYRYGEYITDNEIQTARYLNELPMETIAKMADSFTEGFRIGFINTGKDLSKKSTVNIRYSVGFERVVKRAVDNFAKMGLKPTVYRAAVSVLTRKQQFKVGYYATPANKQYDYDHRADQGLFLDRRYMERRLDVMKNVYEQNKELAAHFAGPAVIETFGEKPFVPAPNEDAVKLTEKQEELSLMLDTKAGQLTNRYIKGEERSFTIVAYPLPEIGRDYRAIFQEVVRINTLDAKLYEEVQQRLIDALDMGKEVRVLGRGTNRTDLTIQLHPLSNPLKETVFENCVADVNIPVGEVFTSPVLEGTKGILHVSSVYLNELQYKDLKLTFEDGRITGYTCGNFEQEEENKAYIFENVLYRHDTLPLGEFAIGTNTTAYAAAKKYEIEDKLPILIAEKMGPHFAVGDTCYSWSEDNKVYNQNGKEIIAKDNSISVLRKEDAGKAYFHCHTDITIPYEEIGEISVLTHEGETIILLKEGRFVLPGTEILNGPLDELDKRKEE